jgi:tetratricopeptide (TPR) repeat protein
MKKILLISFFAAGTMILSAQSLEQGNKELYYERFQSAAHTFEQLISQDSKNTAAWYGLSRAYLLDGKNSKAINLLTKIPDNLRNDPYCKLLVGEILLNQENNTEAEKLFGQALSDTRQKNIHILSAIAQAHISAKKGDAGFAIELLHKAIKHSKHNSFLYELLGDAYLRLNDGSEAYKSYKEAIDRNNQNAAAYHGIGEIFLSQKSPELYVEYFRKAIAADSNYAPALYKLYVYEFYHNPSKAMVYYKDYMSKSDISIQNDYDMMDLLYVNKQYQDAIQKAGVILTKEQDSVRPRLFKLISYSYAAEGDTSKAIAYLQQYFDKQHDTDFISKDFISMGEFYAATPGQDSLAMAYFEKGVALEKDSAELAGHFKVLADLSKNRNDFSSQAKWLGAYYQTNHKATNLDLFNWGLAYYKAGNYLMADTVFSRYAAKYPDQSFGYYWQARSKALQDKDMKDGLAIDAYKKLIEVLADKPIDINSRKWMIDAYGYLAAYEANTMKNYMEARNYFEKVLEIDPENTDAKKYIEVLDNSLADKGTK